MHSFGKKSFFKQSIKINLELKEPVHLTAIPVNSFSKKNYDYLKSQSNIAIRGEDAVYYAFECDLEHFTITGEDGVSCEFECE